MDKISHLRIFASSHLRIFASLAVLASTSFSTQASNLWSTVGSTGTVDEDSTGTVIFGNFPVGASTNTSSQAVGVKSSTGTVNIRYPISGLFPVPAPSLPVAPWCDFCGDPTFIADVPTISTTLELMNGVTNGKKLAKLKVRFADTGSYSQVVLKLVGYNIDTGAITLPPTGQPLLTFDSNYYPSVNGFQTQTLNDGDCSKYVTLDTNNNVYYIDAQIVKSGSAGKPALGAIMLVDAPECSTWPGGGSKPTATVQTLTPMTEGGG